MSDLGIAFSGVLLGTIFTGAFVAAAVLARRNGPTVQFVRRHIRATWLILGAVWGSLAVLRLLDPPSSTEPLHAWIALAGSLCFVIMGLLQRPLLPDDTGRMP